MRALLVFVAIAMASAADLKPISPAGVTPVGPYSPGLMAGEYLYVSGQGARNAAGQMADNFEAQTRQCLDNVKAVVEAGGLTMAHIVSTQVYLADMRNYDAFNKIFAEYFPKEAPARSTIGVTRMPTETPVEVAAVAVNDLKLRKPVKLAKVATGPASLGVSVGDRFYMSGLWGRHPQSSSVPKDVRAQFTYVVDRAKEVLKSAGLELRNMVAVNVYVDGSLPSDLMTQLLQDLLPSETAVTVIPTVALPGGSHIELAGVAGKNAKRSGRCTSLGETLYCSGRTGSTAEILAQLKTDLDAAKTNMSRVVASNVYIDDIDNFASMNKTYAGAFATPPPTRTTVQPLGKKLAKGNTISLIAVQ